VGLVYLSVWGRAQARFITRRPVMPGGRADIRDRSVTVSMHMLRELLLGGPGDGPDGASGREVPATPR
jgi:nicotinamide-nucleotide amidase